jgi:hypothetical protein
MEGNDKIKKVFIKEIPFLFLLLGSYPNYDQ